MINLLLPPLRGRKLTNTSCVHPPSRRDLRTREMEGQVTQTLARVSSLDPGSQRATVLHSSPRDAMCRAAAHRTPYAVPAAGNVFGGLRLSTPGTQKPTSK